MNECLVTYAVVCYETGLMAWSSLNKPSWAINVYAYTYVYAYNMLKGSEPKAKRGDRKTRPKCALERPLNLIPKKVWSVGLW